MPLKLPALLLALLLAGGFSTSIYAQRTITGTVSDSQGETLIGVSVYVSGNPGTGTITDLDGVYTLSVDDKAKQLVFSTT